MAIVGTGKWAPIQNYTTSVQDRDYFSGLLTVSNTVYSAGVDLEFGFSAPEVKIVNTSATQLVFEWLNRSVAGKDSGIVPANSKLEFSSANKVGIRLRVEAGSATAYVIAVG